MGLEVFILPEILLALNEFGPNNLFDYDDVIELIAFEFLII